MHQKTVLAALKTLPPVQAEKLQRVLSQDYGGFDGSKNKSKVPRVRVRYDLTESRRRGKADTATNLSPAVISVVSAGKPAHASHGEQKTGRGGFTGEVQFFIPSDRRKKAFGTVKVTDFSNALEWGTTRQPGDRLCGSCGEVTLGVESVGKVNQQECRRCGDPEGLTKNICLLHQDLKKAVERYEQLRPILDGNLKPPKPGAAKSKADRLREITFDLVLETGKGDDYTNNTIKAINIMPVHVQQQQVKPRKIIPSTAPRTLRQPTASEKQAFVKMQRDVGVQQAIEFARTQGVDLLHAAGVEKAERPVGPSLLELQQEEEKKQKKVAEAEAAAETEAEKAAAAAAQEALGSTFKHRFRSGTVGWLSVQQDTQEGYVQADDGRWLSVPKAEEEAQEQETFRSGVPMQRAQSQQERKREMKQQRQQQRQEQAKEEPDRGGGFEPLSRAVQPSNAALEEETERLRQEQQLRAQAAAKPKRTPAKAKAKGGKEEAELQSKQEKELDLKKKMLKKSQKLGVRAAVEWARTKGLDPHIIPHPKDVKACARYCDQVEHALRSHYS